MADLAALQHVADSIRRRLAFPYRVDGVDLQVGASIGVALFPDTAANAEQLLTIADECMYRVKADGDGSPGSGDATSLPSRRRSDKVRRRLGN